jgi:hypothetical protein
MKQCTRRRLLRVGAMVTMKKIGQQAVHLNTTTKHLEVTMSNNKKSNVELLRCKMIALTLLKLNQSDRDMMEHFFEQAKAMHKEEIEKSYNNGWNSGYYGKDCLEENYYHETFRGNND